MLEKMQEMIAAQLNISKEKIKPESSFKDDLNADSLDLFELIMSMEEEFHIEIPADDLEQMGTVNDVCNYLKGKGVAE